jgi:hypothetical protein
VHGCPLGTLPLVGHGSRDPKPGKAEDALNSAKGLCDPPAAPGAAGASLMFCSGGHQTDFNSEGEPDPTSEEQVRFGSLADIRERTRDVRFIPKSGHAHRRHQCLLSAISGHKSVVADGANLIARS